MLRTIFGTSRWLVQRKITTFVPVISVKSAYITTPIKNCEKSLRFRKYSSKTPGDPLPQASDVDPVVYDQVCSETLESLSDYFEELIETSSNFRGADITYSDGVLTVFLGNPYGTYVINRQSPNKQIWLSSPVSGPKRYDLILKDGGYWVYKHDGVTLHKLLQEEISKLTTDKVDFNKCLHSIV